VRPLLHLDSAGEQAVGGVDVAVAVEQVRGGRDRGGQRCDPIGVGLASTIQQLRRRAHVTCHIRTQVGCLGQSAAPLRTERTQLRGAKQCANRAGAVAAPQRQLRGLLEHVGDLLVRLDGRLGEMPDAALRLVRELAGERPVGAAPLVAG